MFELLKKGDPVVWRSALLLFLGTEDADNSEQLFVLIKHKVIYCFSQYSVYFTYILHLLKFEIWGIHSSWNYTVPFKTIKFNYCSIYLFLLCWYLCLQWI